jgi:F-type H+-transporting ATPase subunit delta
MSLIAKRYVKALTESVSSEKVSEFAELFSSLASNFSDVKFKTVATSNLTSKSDKEALFVETLGEVDVELKNFVKLLVEKGRVAEIPAVAEELRVQVANQSGRYEGKLLSSSSVSVEDLQNIAEGLSSKLGKDIVLTASKSDIKGVKVVVDDLNIDVTLSRARIETDIINHILKAI